MGAVSGGCYLASATGEWGVGMTKGLFSLFSPLIQLFSIECIEEFCSIAPLPKHVLAQQGVD